MNGSRVARRYARAAFDLALDHHDIDGWLADLHAIHRFVAIDEVAALMENPAIPFGTKQDLIEQSLPGIGRLRRNFLSVLVQNGRARELGATVSAFERLVNEHRGVAVAQVSTAVPLDDKESTEVARRLEALLGKRVVLEKRVDSSLIGGVVARIGDRLIDGSIAGQLSALRDQLAH